MYSTKLFLPDSENLNFLNIYLKNTQTKFHKNLSSGSRDVPCGQTDRHDRPTVSFHNFAHMPKNEQQTVSIFFFRIFHCHYLHLFIFTSVSLVSCVNIYSDWLREQFCKLSLNMLYIFSLQ
jgi:hypothetical protein